MAEKLYAAFARRRGDTDWQQVTEHGWNYYATYGVMLQRVSMLAQFVPQNEYEIRETDLVANDA